MKEIRKYKTLEIRFKNSANHKYFKREEDWAGESNPWIWSETDSEYDAYVLVLTHNDTYYREETIDELILRDILECKESMRDYDFEIDKYGDIVPDIYCEFKIIKTTEKIRYL